MTDHPDAPRAYPEINHATSALRADARKRGDADGFNLWAGQAHTLTLEQAAADVVRTLAHPPQR
jgi:nitronate monooxygenase